MIIYSGAGLLVPVFAFMGFWFLRDFLDYTLFHRQGYYAAHGWAHFLSALIAGAACYALGTFLSRPTDKVIVDKKTGEETPFRNYHTFFFIPMQWCAFIFVAIGIYLWIAA
jgi:hypothetical protein